MVAASEVSYGKSSLTLNAPPKQGENINIFLRPGDELTLGLDLSKAKLQIIGGDVIAFFPNGGQITFVSLGMMAFENNPPYITSPNGTHLSVEQILNAIQDIGQAPRDSILVSGPASLQDIEQQILEQTKSKTQDAPVNDYNAYYVDPQPNIKPQDDIGPKDNSGKYLMEAVPEFTSDKSASNDFTAKHNSTEDQTKSNIADVSAALSFDVGFYQIKNSDTTDTVAHITTVLGGTGSALGNVSKTASAQFQPETLDYRNDGNKTVITADNPLLVNDTYLTKLVRLSVSQPIGFAITDITITGLSNAFQMLNKDFTSANSSGGGWSLSSATGFSHTPTDGGEVIEFYIRYKPNSADMTLNFDYLMKVNLTSQFDMANVPLLQQAEVVVPELNTLNTFKDIGVIVKTVDSESDYTYMGRYPNGFVVDTTPNENIIYTSKSDATVYGGLSNDTIYGNIGNDTLGGDRGNDTLSGGAGANILDGGEGVDTVNYDFLAKYSDDFIFANPLVSNDAKGVTVDLQIHIATGKTVYDATADFTTGESILDINDTITNIEYVVGSKYDDTIRGDGENNKLMGGEGNDTLEGRGGRDWLDGGAGNDWLIGSTDDYMIDGGDNTDTADFSNTSNGIIVTLNNSNNGYIGNVGGTAATTIIKNVENIAGTQYGDTITGDNSNNLLIGGYDHNATTVTSNDDTISGGAGSDTIVGDVMIDSVMGSVIYAGSDILSGGNDNDTIYGDSAPLLSTSVLSVSADQGVEYIIDTNVMTHVAATLATIYGGNDTLMGGAGDDYLNGGSGYDTVDYSASTAPLIVNLNANYAFGEGYDQLFNIENIKGSSSVLGDTLIGNALNNIIIGSVNGGDTLSGLDGNDTLNGGSGIGKDWADYSYVTSPTGVTVNLHDGTAYVSATDSDTLISIENVIGSNNIDTLTGGAGGIVNTLLGKDGNDIFYGYGDGDTLNGGAGLDTVDYINVSQKLIVTLDGSNADTLIEIENIYGSSNKDTLSGNNDANILSGRGDDDILDGKGGADTLIGGDGNDTFIGGAGNDTLWGGTDATHDSGIDTADYSTSNSINADLTTGIVNDGLGGIDSLAGIEIIIGSAYNDLLKGSAGDDMLIGGGGSDTILATSGADVYWGSILNVPNDGVKDRVDYAGIYNQLIGGISADHIVVDLSLSANNATIASSSGNSLSVHSLHSIEEVIGTDGNDTLKCGIGAQTLFGGEGDDTLSGTISGNYLDGGNGINLGDYATKTQNLVVDLSVVSKNVYLFGTTPVDTNADTLVNIQNVNTGSGRDTLIGGTSANIFKAGLGDDILNGGGGDDTLYGEAGNDTFIGGAGNDTFYGGTDATHDLGIDLADYSSALFGIYADLGAGTVVGNASTEGTDKLYGIENILGSSSADTLIGELGVKNILQGAAGDDKLTGNLDGDILDGGTGSNLADYSAQTVALVANLSTSANNIYLAGTTPDGTNSDSVSYVNNVATGSGDDTLIGNAFANILQAGAGADILIGGGGIDTLYGEGGNDTLTGGLDGDLLDGGAGTDTASYSSYTSTLVTDLFSQKIALSQSDLTSTNKYDTFNNIEIIATGSGNDTFLFSGTTDTLNSTIDGGGGVNLIDYSNLTTSSIVVDLSMRDGNNFATVIVAGGVGGGNDLITNIENITGSKVNDTLTGDTQNNILHGDGGDDKLYGLGGNDTLYGDAGNDTLDGGMGSDIVYGGADNDVIIGTIDGANDLYDGGAGVDTIDYSALTANLTLTAGTTVVSAGNTIGVDTLTAIEIFNSGSGDDVLTGGISAMTIYGNAGIDVITGGSGNDLIYGDNVGNTHIDGKNTLLGGAGNDTLYAGSAGDILQGDAGNDTMYGGIGNDTLNYASSGVAITATLATNTVDAADGSRLQIITGDGADYVDINSIEELRSGSGADLIYGANAGVLNKIYAGGNADQIYGGSLAETLYGEAGNDTIRGGDGADTIFGGTGNDLVYGNIDGDKAYGDDGTGNIALTSDTLDFSDITSSNLQIDMASGSVKQVGNATVLSTFAEFENITGSSGDDLLTGDTNVNIIKGGSGNDTIFVSNGADSIDGGIGIDTIDFSTRATSVSINLATSQILNNGNGEIQTILNVENIVGGSGADTLYGDGASNIIQGGIGADILKGGDGNDVLYATDATFAGDTGVSNTLYGEAGNDTLYGAAGDDTLDGGLGDDTLDGKEGSDILIGGGGDDVIFDTGITGSDTLSYATSSKIITAFALADGTIRVTDGSVTGVTVVNADPTNVGTDTLLVGHGIEEILGSGLNDKFFTQAYRPINEAFILDGGGGNDTIYGGALNDTIFGGANDDTIRGYGGNNILAGGSDTLSALGSDTLDYSYDTQGVKINLASGFTSYDAVAQNRGVHITDTNIAGYAGGTDEVYNFYRVLGGLGNDTIAGNIGVDSISGGGGDDWIVMTTGNDYIDGEANGVSGDTIDYHYIAGGVIVNLIGSVGTGAAGTDDIRNIENVSGSDYADTITGTTGNNVLTGRLGNDTIFGDAGNDIIYGDNNNNNSGLNEINDTESGNDELYGGAGDDTIYGGLGNDRIDGGANNNILYGGGGNDAFWLAAGNDTVYGGSGIDSANYGNSTAIVAHLESMHDIDSIKFAVITQGATTDYLSLSDVEILNGTDSNDTIYGATLLSTVLTNINGGNGNDFFQGSVASIAEVVHGGENNDTIEGGGGADTLYGDGGTDLFYGAIDGDTIYGGTTNETAGGDTIDFLHVTGTPLNIVMGNNNNTNIGSVYANGSGTASSYFYEIENIRGTASNDTIRGDARSNALYGDAGNDTLSGGAGNDYLDGGINTNASGDGDWADFYNDGVIDNINGITLDLSIKTQQLISTSRGSDTILNIENIQATNQNDVITGDIAANYAGVHTILGMAGDDTIILRGGNNYIDGGDGIDTLSYVNENGVTLTLVGGSGIATVGAYTDTLVNIENIIGSNNSNANLAKDIITGDEYANTIRGMTGDDTISGGGGDDYLEGNSDNDTLYGGTGLDTLDGGGGNDYLYGNSATTADTVANKIYGGSGQDNIFGSLSGDTLYGDSSAGASSGQGDILRYDLIVASGVHVNLANMTATGWNGVADLATLDTIGGFANVRGSTSADKLEGTMGAESIYGGAGNDLIVGAGGADTLLGEGGNDTFVFSNVAQMQSASIINGGGSSETNIVSLTTHAGNETITSANMSYIQQISLASGSTSVAAYVANTNNISIIGTAGDDYIIGGTGYTNTIDAGAGNDTVVFAVGDLLGDVVNGGANTDTLKLTGSSAITDTQFASVTNFENLDLTTYTGTSITLGSSAHSAFGNATVNIATTYAAGTTVVTDVSGYGDGLTVNGGSGSDDIIIARGQTITVNGSTGTADILEFKDAGIVNSSNFLATINGIEQIKFSNLGTNNITLDASALNGYPTLVGGSNADTFNYFIANLSSADIIDGGAGVDTLNFLDAGVILGSNMSGISNIEVIKFADGGNIITVDKDTVSLIGGSGNDIFNYAVTNLSSTDTINGGSGIDKLVMTGSGAFFDNSLLNIQSVETLDLNASGITSASVGLRAQQAGVTFVDASARTSNIAVNVGTYASSFTITAGSGTADTLQVSGAVLTDTIFSNITNFEILDISAVTNNITLGSNANTAGFLTIQDTLSSAKTIDVSADTIGTSGAKLVVNAGTGADTIIVNDQNQFVSVDGGIGGINTLKFASSLTGGQTGSSTTIGNVSFSHIQKIQLSDSGNDIALDASAVGVTIIGGAGIDIFRYVPTDFSSADILQGGASNDTLLFTAPSATINGTVFGSNLTSIDVIQLADGGNTITNYAYTSGSLVGGSGNDTISVTSGTSSVKIYGGDGADWFNFATATDLANATTATTLVGGNQTDTLVVSGNTNLIDTNFSKVATIETLDISSLTALTATVGAMAHTTGITTITDIGSSAKTIDVSAFGNYALSINANGASDANDIFTLDGAQTNVSVNAGASTGDTLKITGSTAIADALFANKTSTEILDITSSSATTVTLGTNANTSGIIVVNDTGSTGKTINVSADNIGTNAIRLSVNAGTGADTIIADSTNYYTINGGTTGVNTLTLSNLLTASEMGYSTVIGNINYNNIGIVQLANGGNTVAFDLFTSGANISLVGGSGNDVFKYSIATMNADNLFGGSGADTLLYTDSGTIVNANLSGLNSIEVIQFANGANNITVDKDGVTLIGGSGIDTFNYSGTGAGVGQFSTSDIINGGTGGMDILAFTTAGAIDATQFTNLTNIAQIQLANGTNTVTGYSYTNGSLIGGTGNDTITIASGTNGVKVYTGTGADIVNVSNVTDLNNTTINGGIDHLDKVVITTTSGGTINATNVTNVAEIDLASGGTAYTINTNISIVGSIGADSIIGGAGVDNTISARNGADIVQFDVANLNSSDYVWGGNDASTDIFKVTGSTALTDALLTNVKEFETLDISSLNANVTLGATASGFTSIADSGTTSQTIDVSAYAGLSSVTMGSTGVGGDTLVVTSSQVITVTGSAGSNDTVQLSNVITGGGNIAVTSLTNIEKIQLANGNNDVTLDKNNISILGGTGDDTFNYAITNLSSSDIINGGAGTNTLKITGSSAVTDAAFTHITNIQKLDLSGYTGTITYGSTIVPFTTIAFGSSTATFSADALVMSGITATGTNGTLHVSNLQGKLDSSFTNVASGLTVTADWASGTGIYTGDFTNIDSLTISGGTMSVNDSILGILGVTGAGSLTVNVDDASSNLTNVNIGGTLTINDGSGTQTLLGSVNADIFNLHNASSTSDGKDGGDTYNASVSTNITDTGISGTDSVHVMANNLDFSGKTISGIETFDLGATTGTTLNATEADSINISGSGTSAFTIAGSAGADTVDLTGNLGAFTGSFSFNGSDGDDHLSLDFSKLSSLSMDGGANTDTLSLNNIANGSNIGATGFNNISNIETLDISSLSSGNMSIDFAALDHIATNANNIDLKLNSTSTASLNNLTEVYLSTDVGHTTNLAVSGSWTTSNAANYDVIHGTDTFTLHVLTV